MPTHGPTHFLRGARGRFAAILLLGALVADPQVASTEPLGYVLRPARQDIGVMDGRSNTVLGGISLSTALLGGDIGTLNFLTLSPDGRVGLIGATHMGLSRLDLLSTRVVEASGLRSVPDAVDATAAVFHPDSSIAYVSVRGSGLLLEVGTSAGGVEILRSWEAPTYVRLFYVPQLREAGSDNNPPAFGPFLFGLQEDGRVSGFDLVLGREIGPENANLRAQLAAFGAVTDMTVEPDGSVWALTFGGDILNMPGALLGSIRIDPFGVPTNAGDLVDGPAAHFAISEGGLALYLAGEHLAAKVECFSTSGSGSTGPSEPKPVTHCMEGGRLIVTPISLSEALEPDNTVPLDGYNPIEDVTLTSDEATLYIVGRRTIFTVDTATATLVARFRMRAGGGEVGQMAIADAVEPCVPQSTSLYALRGEAKRMSTSTQSQNKVFYKLKKAQMALSASDIATGRNALRAAIAQTVYRSNLPVGDPDRIPPEEAASVVCAAGNLLERVRAE